MAASAAEEKDVEEEIVSILLALITSILRQGTMVGGLVVEEEVSYTSRGVILNLQLSIYMGGWG